jgi:hypothetical protein
MTNRHLSPAAGLLGGQMRPARVGRSLNANSAGEHGPRYGPDPACDMDSVVQASLSEGRLRDEHSVLKPTLGRSRGVPRRLATFDNGIGAAVVNVEPPPPGPDHEWI